MADLLNTSNASLAPSARTTETALPDWYTNYAAQIVSNQNEIAAQPYTAYSGPRVADFTGDQQAGFQMTRDAAGAYKPGLAQATQTVGALAGLRPSEMAQPWMSQAGQSAPSVVGQYMDPYQDFVVDRIGQLGARNLSERLLPQISDQFIGAGGFGGSRQAEAIGRAIRDTQEGISAEQNKALSQGYQSSLGAAQNDLSRYGTLAGLAGNLGAQDISSGLAVGNSQADLAAMAQQLGLQGAGALQSVGAQQQAMNQKNLDVAYEDFLRQQSHGQTQLDNMTKTLQGVAPAVPKATLEQGYGPAAQQTQSPSTLQSLAGVLGALLL
jgi:hypothetical protein